MTTIYLVMRKGGEYDDKWMHVDCAKYNEADAIAAVATADAHDQYLRELDKRCRTHMSKFVNPTPPMLLIQIARKKWPAGMREVDITQEMRDERAAIDKQNEATTVPFRENQHQRFLEQHNEEVRYLTVVEGLSQADAEVKASNSWSTKWNAPDEDVRNYYEAVEVD